MAKKKAKSKSTTAAKKPMTKTEVFTALADKTGMSKKEVASVFEALTEVVGKNLGRRGPKIFSLPGLVKLKVVHKPAKKARKGTNPFTGEEMMFKAKPAHNVVKALPLKALKDMAL